MFLLLTRYHYWSDNISKMLVYQRVPMTDPWCWYINANIKGVFIDGIHGAPYIEYMDPMGNVCNSCDNVNDTITVIMCIYIYVNHYIMIVITAIHLENLMTLHSEVSLRHVHNPYMFSVVCACDSVTKARVCATVSQSQDSRVLLGTVGPLIHINDRKIHR